MTGEIRTVPGWSELTNDILDFVTQTSETTIPHICAAFPDVSPGVIRVYLSRLARRGQIIRTSRGIYLATADTTGDA